MNNGWNRIVVSALKYKILSFCHNYLTIVFLSVAGDESDTWELKLLKKGEEVARFVKIGTEGLRSGQR